MLMTARLLYTQKGSDPATIAWPPGGPPYQRFTLTTGVVLTVPDLIGYGDGSVTYVDGRQLPPITPAGSTIIHQKS